MLKSYPKELQITELRTISNEVCRDTYSSMTLETELCTFKWGTGACSVSAVNFVLLLQTNVLKKHLIFRAIRAAHWLIWIAIVFSEWFPSVSSTAADTPAFQMDFQECRISPLGSMNASSRNRQSLSTRNHRTRSIEIYGRPEDNKVSTKMCFC